MLDYFGVWGTVQRQQRALFHALARWQNDPARHMGDFGLSVTTEYNHLPEGLFALQFSLRHRSGGLLQSGEVIIEFTNDADELSRKLPGIAMPLLREFLMPSGFSAKLVGLPTLTEVGR